LFEKHESQMLPTNVSGFEQFAVARPSVTSGHTGNMAVAVAQTYALLQGAPALFPMAQYVHSVPVHMGAQPMHNMTHNLLTQACVVMPHTHTQTQTHALTSNSSQLVAQLIERLRTYATQLYADGGNILLRQRITIHTNDITERYDYLMRNLELKSNFQSVQRILERLNGPNLSTSTHGQPPADLQRIQQLMAQQQAEAQQKDAAVKQLQAQQKHAAAQQLQAQRMAANIHQPVANRQLVQDLIARQQAAEQHKLIQKEKRAEQAQTKRIAKQRETREGQKQAAKKDPQKLPLYPLLQAQGRLRVLCCCLHPPSPRPQKKNTRARLCC
jgi:hypothetical protein